MFFFFFYSQNFKNEDSFILNYKVINNRIIVNYANGNVDIFVYSIDREKEILIQMKEQVLGSKGCLKSLYNETMIYFKLLTNKLALFIFFVAIMLFFDVSLLAAAVTFTYFPIVIGLLVRKLIKCKGVIEDVKKNLLFLSNEEKINSDIRNKSEVRENIVDEFFGIGTRYVNFAHMRYVKHTYVVAHSLVLFNDRCVLDRHHIACKGAHLCF